MTVRTISVPRINRGARPRVLDPILVHLRKARAESPVAIGNDGMVALHFLGRELSIDAWTSDTLDRYFRSTSPGTVESVNLVAQGVALMAKCELDLVAFEMTVSPIPADLYEAQAKLMLNAAMGQSLASDIQTVIDDLLRQGGVEEARNFSVFQHRLRNAVAGIRTRVAAENRASLKSLSDQLTKTVERARGGRTTYQIGPAPPEEADHPAPRGVRSPVAIPLCYPQRQDHERAEQEAAREKKDRTSIFRITPAPAQPREGPLSPWWSTGMLAAMLVLTLIPLIATRRSVPSSTGTRRAAGSVGVTLAGTVEEVRDRWPSMFVTVNAESWTEMSALGRMELVRDLGGRLAAKRYEGALIAAENGRPVAQWSHASGVRLLDESAETSLLPARKSARAQ